jgi:hypothetical protein
VNAAVFIMNARAIPEALDSYRALEVDLIWATGYTVAQLADGVHRDAVEHTDYDVILNLSDDCVVTQAALDAVLALLDDGHPAATGWCRMAVGMESVNLCDRPLSADVPWAKPFPYSLMNRTDVVRYPDEVVPTHFMGMSLTGMTRDLWQRYPYGCYTERRPRGQSSDFHLSARLRDAGVPMVAARSGEVQHLKEMAFQGASYGPVHHPWLVGNVEPSLTIDPAGARLATTTT